MCDRVEADTMRIITNTYKLNELNSAQEPRSCTSWTKHSWSQSLQTPILEFYSPTASPGTNTSTTSPRRQTAPLDSFEGISVDAQLPARKLPSSPWSAPSYSTVPSSGTRTRSRISARWSQGLQLQNSWVCHASSDKAWPPNSSRTAWRPAADLPLQGGWGAGSGSPPWKISIPPENQPKHPSSKPPRLHCLKSSP